MQQLFLQNTRVVPGKKISIQQNDGKQFFKIKSKKDERETTKEVEANIVIWFELQKYERLFP